MAGILFLIFLEFGSELSEGNEEEMKTFNEDIVCSHGTVPSTVSTMILENTCNNDIV